MKSHPIHCKDADVGCAWLCASAGNRSNADNAAFAEALSLFCGHTKKLPYVDMLQRVK